MASPRAVLLCLLLFPLSLGFAQEADPLAAPAADEIRGRISAVEANTALSAEEIERVTGVLRSALEALQRADAAEAERAQQRAAADAAPEAMRELAESLAKPPEPLPLGVDPQPTVAGVRSQLEAATTELEAVQAEVGRLQGEATLRQTFEAEAPQRIADLESRIEQLELEIAGLTGSEPLIEATRLQKRAERAAARAEVERLRATAASYAARRELLPLRRSSAQRRAELLGRLVEELQKLEGQLRTREAEAQRREADRQLEQDRLRPALEIPGVQEVLEDTRALTQKRTGPDGIVARLARVQQRSLNRARELQELQVRARNTAARVRATGLTDAVSLLLRTELGKIPRVEQADLDRLERSIGDAQFELIGVEERLDRYGDVQASVQRLARDASPQAQAGVQEIVQSHVEVLGSLRDEYGEYLEEATNLLVSLVQLRETSRELRSFIEERILWTRSVPGSPVPRPRDLTDGVAWLTGGIGPDGRSRPIGSAWLGIAQDLRPTVPAVLLTLAVPIAFVLKRMAKRELSTLAGRVRRFSTDSFALTVRAIPVTVLMALPPALTLLLAGVLLAVPEDELARALADGFEAAAVFAFVAEFVRQGSRPDGLADAHFRWRRDGLLQFRRWILVSEVVGLPLAVAIVALHAQPDADLNNALGRVLFVLAMVGLSVLYIGVFAPWRPFVRNHLVRKPGSLSSRLRWVWFPVLAVTPLVLAALAALGYFYTAVELDERLHFTMWLVVSVTVVHSLVLRWLFIERRRLLVERARQRREGGQEGEGERPAEADIERELDAADVDAQTRRVVTAFVVLGVVIGMYALWVEQLPALRMFERVQIWPTVDLVPERANSELLGAEVAQLLDQADGEEQAAADASPTLFPGLGSAGGSGESEPIGVITLADVGGALIVIILTWVLARNLPGLLEITVLKRLPFDAGARFAISAILRYMLGIIGILIGFGALGIGWSQVQWLAAALTFGLAFGLQEIFANFISGLIILVERPVRVGDTVTVDQTSGKVTKIRMRATTVQDWQLRELVIPNKVFITDRFINWTLSDPSVRVDVPVGVAYGTDPRIVTRTLLDIGQSQPHVMREPRVRALFMGFGDSTLNFELRVYIEHFDYFLDTRTELHARVAERFKQLGIEIAFPQRDLHVRSIGPLADIVRKAGDGEGIDARVLEQA
ncbi:MAG: mechanosensitive ion channel domain-containing protein [Planctomycetota bacterium]